MKIDFRIKIPNVTELKRQRMLSTIEQLVKQGVYPSAAKISKAMGRKTKTLNGPECIERRKIFRELGIKLKEGGWISKFTYWLEEFQGLYE